jgi:MFS family permease
MAGESPTTAELPTDDVAAPAAAVESSQRAAAGGLRTFAVVAVGQFVSVFGSALTAFALGTWVYKQTGSVTYLATIILSYTLPGILIAPLAGSVVDRFDRRRVMLASNCLACAAELAVGVLLLGGELRLWWFYVLAAVLSLAEAFQEPAYAASVPLLVPKSQLGRASGVMQLGQGIARIIAPVLAGFMLVTWGVVAVVLTDMATFAVALATLLRVRFPRPAATAEGAAGRGSLWSEAAAGWAYLVQRPGLVAILVQFTAVNFLVATVNVLYIPLVLSIGDEALLGVILTAGGVGMLAGGAAVTALGTPRRKIAALMSLIFVGGVVIALTGVRPNPWLIGGCGFAMMFVLPVLQATSQVLWQTKVALDVQGRVFALRRMLSQATLPAAILAAGPLADWLFEPLMRDGGRLAERLGPWIGVGPGRGIGLMFVILGTLGCLFAAAGYLHPRIRHLERELPDVIAE